MPLAGTGLYRYARELTRAIAGELNPDEATYEVWSTPESAEPDWVPGSIRVGRTLAPRRPLHLAWCVAGRPRLETIAGPADLLHVLSPVFPVPSRSPTIYTVMDLFALDEPASERVVDRWIFRRAIHAAACASHLIVPSEATRREVTERLGVPVERVTVIPLGVDQEFAASSTPDEIRKECARYGAEAGKYFIALGAVNRRKNIATLVAAISRLPRTDRVRLLVVGPDGPASADIRAAIQAAGLNHAAILTGPVTQRELAALLRGAMALVHPAVAEGFGFTPLEAMAAGIPTVVARSGSLPEVAGDASLLVDPLDVVAWTAALEQLENDESLRCQLTLRGRANALRFSWARTATETMAVHRRFWRSAG